MNNPFLIQLRKCPLSALKDELNVRSILSIFQILWGGIATKLP